LNKLLMEQNKSIALLVCYFGKLPWYFPYFVHSCKYNPTIDFYIITDDQSYPGPMPANVYLLYRSMQEVNVLIAEKLSLPVDIKYGYKFCDFKPAYGLIFSDILKDYDFWGHCDIDIIFGDIREFIIPELLDNYELISVRHDWLSGCFLLYRNNEKLNTLFRESRDWQKVFTEDKHYCFDETNFKHDDFTDGKTYLEVESEIESMTHVVKRLEDEGRLIPFFDFFIIEGLPGKLKWENGKMYYKNKFEVLFYHLIYFKSKQAPKQIQSIPNKFAISPNKIYTTKQSKTVN